jgi:nitrite reductase/ring-hydroxylating ferredoxin subunit
MTTWSGYGRIGVVPKENEELTRAGLGTPMGESLRRYWQPICLSGDIDELPKLVTILGEELVDFRDKRGRVGVLDARCYHRGTSLEYGRIEDDGIRYCYHGWLFAADGRCLQQPGEPPDSNFKSKVAQPAYPALEFGGLVFAYLGPPDKEPLFPRFDILEQPGWANAFRRAVAEQPGKHTIGTTPAGGMFLTAQHLIRRGDVQLTTVPYGGAGPALTALLGGHIDAV